MSQPEQVKRFTLLPTEWTPITGELTPSLKLKRRAIAERHAAEIEAMYENVRAPSRPREGTSGVVTSESRR